MLCVLLLQEHNYKFDAVPSDKSSGSLRLLDDCLSSLINTSFSTFDKDNDGDDNVTCASTYQSGWWFKGPSCARCNPTGLKPQSMTAVNVREVFWGNIVPTQLFAYLVANQPKVIYSLLSIMLNQPYNTLLYISYLTSIIHILIYK